MPQIGHQIFLNAKVCGNTSTVSGQEGRGADGRTNRPTSWPRSTSDLRLRGKKPPRPRQGLYEFPVKASARQDERQRRFHLAVWAAVHATLRAIRSLEIIS